MPERDVDLLIEDCGDRQIERYIGGLGREAFPADDSKVAAGVRNLEVR